MWRCFSLAFQIPVALDFVGFERSFTTFHGVKLHTSSKSFSPSFEYYITCNAIKDNGTLFSIFLKQIVLAWF